jgi:hypothetical protein
MHRGIIRMTCPKTETTFSSNGRFKTIEHIINTVMSNSDDYDNIYKIQYNNNNHNREKIEISDKDDDHNTESKLLRQTNVCT